MADDPETSSEVSASQPTPDLASDVEPLSIRDEPKSSASSDSHLQSKSTPSNSKPKNALKVDILLKHAGDAPIMNKRKWTVDRSKKIAWVASFIKKYIKSEPSESLFLYVNQSFAPSPDTDLGSIFDCFGSDGKLVLHYCRTQAWG